MTYLAITSLSYEHIRQRVIIQIAGETVSGQLDAYCRYTSSYTLMIDGHYVRNVPMSARLELFDNLDPAEQEKV